MAERYVLDTSAIFALTDQEEGAVEVEGLLDAAAADACEIEMASISLMELYYITLREQGEDDAGQLVALVKSWPVAWVYPDEKMLLQAAKLSSSRFVYKCLKQGNKVLLFLREIFERLEKLTKKR